MISMGRIDFGFVGLEVRDWRLEIRELRVDVGHGERPPQSGVPLCGKNGLC